MYPLLSALTISFWNNLLSLPEFLLTRSFLMEDLHNMQMFNAINAMIKIVLNNNELILCKKTHCKCSDVLLYCVKYL